MRRLVGQVRGPGQVSRCIVIRVVISPELADPVVRTDAGRLGGRHQRGQRVREALLRVGRRAVDGRDLADVTLPELLEALVAVAGPTVAVGPQPVGQSEEDERDAGVGSEPGHSDLVALDGLRGLGPGVVGPKHRRVGGLGAGLPARPVGLVAVGVARRDEDGLDAGARGADVAQERRTHEEERVVDVRADIHRRRRAGGGRRRSDDEPRTHHRCCEHEGRERPARTPPTGRAQVVA